MGETSATQLCHFTSFAQAASAVLGGPKAKSKASSLDDYASPEQAVAALNALWTVG